MVASSTAGSTSRSAVTWAGVREYQFRLAVTDCPVV
jgi:hypothetical protein